MRPNKCEPDADELAYEPSPQERSAKLRRRRTADEGARRRGDGHRAG
jgi:hypothetical protein